MNYPYIFLILSVNVLWFLEIGAKSGHDSASKEKKQLIIDTDVGSDDAVAILNLIGAKELFDACEIKLITTVHGNTHVDNVGVNVLKTLKTAQHLDIPVYKGANESILITPKVDNFFGKDGFGDFDYPDPPSEDLIKKEVAAVALVEAVALHPGELTLVCLGPLTNIAMAIKLNPKFMSNLKEIFVLGGSDSGVGNIKPGVEFNIYIDPEAAYIVFKEAEKHKKLLNVVTWETALRTDIDMEWRISTLGKIDNPRIDLLNKAERLGLNKEKWVSSDAILSAVVLDPQIVESSKNYHIDIEVCGIYGRGAFFVDYDNNEKLIKNVRVIKSINIERYKQMLLTNLNPQSGYSNGASRSI